MEQRRIPDIIGPQTLVTLTPRDCAHDATLAEAWDRMSRGGYRHLPVVADGSAVGIVSVRDLYAAVTPGLQADLEERIAFIAGVGPGGLN